MFYNVYKVQNGQKELIKSCKGADDFKKFKLSLLKDKKLREKLIGKNFEVYSLGLGAWEFGGFKFHTEDEEPLEITSKETGELTTTDFTLHVEGEQRGLVLSTGTIGHNFFGPFDAYLSKITPRNFVLVPKNNTRVFDKSSLLKFIQKHEGSLKYGIEHHGFVLKIETINCEMDTEEIQEYLDELNNLQATDEEMLNEALSRMKELDLYEEVIKDFPKRLWKSEFNGILYYLPQDDNETMEAIESCKSEDYLPYHAIKTHSEIGTMISVLGVSRDKSKWVFERPNHQQLECFVYNPEFGLEHGPIGYSSFAGGLIRTE